MTEIEEWNDGSEQYSEETVEVGNGAIIVLKQVN